MRIYLTGIVALALFTGCGPSVDTPLAKKLIPYDIARHQCADFISGKEELTSQIEQECKVFLDRLDTANTTANKLSSGKLKKGEAKEKGILYDRERNRLRHSYEKLSRSIRDATLAAIQRDDTETFIKGINFPGNTFIEPYYNYMKSKAPRFEKNEHYLAYEQTEGDRLRKDGDDYMKIGRTKRALVAYEKAASMNNAQAAHAVGTLYQDIDLEKAIKWHKVAVEGGNKDSYLNLGVLYDAKGEKEEALKWYLKAAEINNPQAEYKLYKYYSKNDKAQAQQWLIKSSHNNYPPAQYQYALRLLEENKIDKAIDLLHNASTQGYTKASDYLGQYYYDLGFYARAFKVLKRSESAASLTLQAKMYEEGKGVNKDYRKAYTLYSHADALGQKDAKDNLKRISALMSASQQKMSEAYRKEYEKSAALMVKECGKLPTPKSVTKKNVKFHITGTASAPNGRDFVIYGDDGEDYYVQNAKGISEDDHVDISVLSTGRTASMSYASDEESVEINQFTYIKKCVIEKEQ